jgi:hypothetical protein
VAAATGKPIKALHFKKASSSGRISGETGGDAIYEFRAGTAPIKVVMDEALELAKKFSSEESPAFLNGVLDAAHKKLEDLERS